jgi:hypothetical protein
MRRFGARSAYPCVGSAASRALNVANLVALRRGLYGSTTPEGTVLDTVYRLVDALPPAVPTVDLRTPSFSLDCENYRP